uniref:ethanolamine kinase n=1 Tax=Macrostomum lignano TaxID=282301 RepID=A0A1I8FK73_9PLAT
AEARSDGDGRRRRRRRCFKPQVGQQLDINVDEVNCVDIDFDNLEAAEGGGAAACSAAAAATAVDDGDADYDQPPAETDEERQRDVQRTQAANSGGGGRPHRGHHVGDLQNAGGGSQRNRTIIFLNNPDAQAVLRMTAIARRTQAHQRQAVDRAADGRGHTERGVPQPAQPSELSAPHPAGHSVLASTSPRLQSSGDAVSLTSYVAPQQRAQQPAKCAAPAAAVHHGGELVRPACSRCWIMSDPTWQLANCGPAPVHRGHHQTSWSRCTMASDSNSVMTSSLIRIYGEKTELIIDRQAEVRNMRLLHLHGFCKPVYATFANGLCYGYVHGDNLTPTRMHGGRRRAGPGAHLWPTGLARELASLHCLQVPSADGENPPPLSRWSSPPCGRFLRLGPDEFPSRTGRPVPRFPAGQGGSPRRGGRPLEAHLAGRWLSCGVQATNDTLIKNFVYDRREQRYCAHNYLPFDLANHFNEFAGVATVDHSRCAGTRVGSFSCPGCATTCQYRDGFLGGGGAESTELSELRQLYREVTKFFSGLASGSAPCGPWCKARHPPSISTFPGLRHQPLRR